MKPGTNNILPIVVILAAVLLVVAGCREVKTNAAQVKEPAASAKASSPASQEPTHFKAGDLTVVVAQYPAKVPTDMRLIEVEEEAVDTDTVLAQFGFDRTIVRERSAPEIGGYQYVMDAARSGKKYNESVTIEPGGKIVYRRDGKNPYRKDEPHFDTARARKMVEEFIKSHGGLPEDAVLAGFEPSSHTRIGKGKKTKEIIHRYMATYLSRDYEGYPIRGANRITVFVDDEGVISYDRFWRHPKRAAGQPLKLVDPKTAVTGALKLIASSPMYSSPELFGSGVVDLYTIEPTYFSPEPAKRAKYLRPAYSVRFMNTSIVAYADAVTGEGINVGPGPGATGDEFPVEKQRRLSQRVWDYKKEHKITSQVMEPPSTTHYTWAGGPEPSLPKEMPLYIRERRRLSEKDVVKTCEMFGTKEPLPTSDESFYRFGSAKKGELKAGRDYTLEMPKEGDSLSFQLVGWEKWSAEHPQLPSPKEAEAAAIAFLKPRGLLPKEVGQIKVSVDRAEYGQPGNHLVKPPAVWVHIQSKVGGYPTLDMNAEPDPYSLGGIGIGSGGKVLTAWGALPVRHKTVTKRLRSLEDAIAELNESRGSSNADNDHLLDKGWYGFAVGPDLKLIKPKIFEYKLTSVEIAYQVRYAKSGEQYFGPVYAFTIADTQGNRPNKITVPAARP